MTHDVVTGDCIAAMKTLPAGCARLVFADPPFGIGFAYDVYDDRTSSAEYLKWAGRWVSEAARLVAPDGSFFLAIGDEYAAHYKLMLDAVGFTMRNWIVWEYGFGEHCQTKFSRCHAHILYYVRDESNFVWNGDAIKVPSAREVVYGDKRAAAGGRTPSDVWHVPRVCGTFRERVKRAEGTNAHPCQMPQAILERIVAVSSRPGDLVVDPFGGSGTTISAAKRLGRRGWTCELSPNYAAVIRERLAEVSVFGEELAGRDLDDAADALFSTDP